MKANPVPTPNRPPFPNYQAPPATRATTGGGNQNQ
jgi:hypothetical protein